ncbi:DUF1616 domain-containing protein [Methanolobus sp.]|uniref:DUF1616 domain-containing protein n=1 Tax=Methanolobus sp. TaxID=1874737 RepID=UPI0025FDF59B|nr:DUF1616 domain-containing protein [Methanolobus sp.]
MVKSRVPWDILGIVAGVLLTNMLVFNPFINTTELRILPAILIVLFLPGYAMTAALFPRKDEISGAERIAFSIGLSVALVPFIGYGLLYTSWGMNTDSLVISISIVTLVMCAVAFFRRRRLPQGDAFSIPGSFFRLSGSSSPEGKRSRLETALALLLLISVFMSAITVAYVTINPRQGEGFTEFYILGPDGMSDRYPVSLNRGDSGEVIVGVMNQEEETVDYRLAVLLDGNPLPLQTEEENIRIENNERWERTLSFTPEISGNDMKLQFLLYKDADLSEPYRELYLWIDVNEN